MSHQQHARPDAEPSPEPVFARPAAPRVLSIAGTDPTGGAGLQADLKSIAANGGYGMGAVTALVAQNTCGVRSVHTPPASFLIEQLEAVSDDVEIDAVKIGMLGSAEVIAAVRSWLSAHRPPVVVLDPVMVATSGDRLLDETSEEALRQLLPLADLVTPNLPELAVLAQTAVAQTWEQALEQAQRVAREHGAMVLAKGGHLSGSSVPDALVGTGGILAEFPGVRVETTSTHGTGCSLSSAVATRAAAAVLPGEQTPSSEAWAGAVREAKAWLAESLRHGDSLRVGHGHGPVSHFAGLWARGGLETAPQPQEATDLWWERIAGLREEIDGLEFVRRLGDGTLPREAFRWYLAQDSLYLREYSRALAAASLLAPTAEEQAFWAGSAQGAIVSEMQLHGAWVPESELAGLKSSPTTARYTGHLLAIAARGDYEVLIAALLPCFWLYLDAGQRLLEKSHPEHPYASWITTYADEEFAQAAQQAIEIVGRSASRADSEARARMFEAFRVSSVYERDFFEAPLARCEETESITK